jgi:hypothetical protein
MVAGQIQRLLVDGRRDDAGNLCITSEGHRPLDIRNAASPPAA